MMTISLAKSRVRRWNRVRPAQNGETRPSMFAGRGSIASNEQSCPCANQCGGETWSILPSSRRSLASSAGAHCATRIISNLPNPERLDARSATHRAAVPEHHRDLHRYATKLRGRPTFRQHDAPAPPRSRCYSRGSRITAAGLSDRAPRRNYRHTAG